MTLAWPEALPPFPIEADGLYAPNTITTEIDHGPRKKRRRYTAVGRRVSVRDWYLKGDDLETLFHFYEVDTMGGAEAFSMSSPMNGMGEIVARFDSQPRWQIVVPSDHSGSRCARVELDLEILP